MVLCNKYQTKKRNITQSINETREELPKLVSDLTSSVQKKYIISRIEFTQENLNSLMNDMKSLERDMVDLACEVISEEKPLNDLQIQLEKDTRGYQGKVEELVILVSEQEYSKYSRQSESGTKLTDIPKGTGRYRQDLSPDKLLWDSQPLEVKSFITKFKSWIGSGHPEGTDLNPFYTKEIRFKVDSRWSQELENEFKDWDKVKWEDIVKAIHERIAVRFPKLQRQLQVVESKQQKNEDLRTFTLRVLEQAQVANISEGLSEQQFLVLSILSGMIDIPMKEKLMLKFSGEEMNTDKILQFGDTATSVKASCSTPGTGQSGAVKKNNFKKCSQCNRMGHLKESCHAPQCKYCHIYGHSMERCFQNPASDRYDPNFKGPTRGKANRIRGTIRKVRVAVTQHNVNPEIEVEKVIMRKAHKKTQRCTIKGEIKAIKKKYGGESDLVGSETPPMLGRLFRSNSDLEGVKIKLLPDSGASVSVVCKKIIQKHRMKYRKVPKDKYAISDAQGENILIEGTTVLEVRIKGEKGRRQIPCLVSPDLSEEEIILSWQQCQDWGILGHNFPYPSDGYSGCDKEKQTTPHKAEETVQFVPPMSRTYIDPDPKAEDYEEQMRVLLDKVKQDIMLDYSKAFEDSLNTETSPKSEPVKLEIDDTAANPTNYSTARRCPANLEPDANKQISDMIDADIIEEVHSSSRWCARGAFIPKAKGGVRLVVNFQPLNRYCKRAGWPFASTEHIKNSLKTDSRLFWTMDFTRGYFQVPV